MIMKKMLTKSRQWCSQTVGFLDSHHGLVTAIATIFLVAVTGILARTTHKYVELTNRLLEVQKDPILVYDFDTFKYKITLRNGGDDDIGDIRVCYDGIGFFASDLETATRSGGVWSGRDDLNPANSYYWSKEVLQTEEQVEMEMKQALESVLQLDDGLKKFGGWRYVIMKITVFYRRGIDKKEYTKIHYYHVNRADNDSSRYVIFDLVNIARGQPSRGHLTDMVRQLAEMEELLSSLGSID